MSIIYEWKVDFPLLLTILGVICSFVYTNISNRRNKHSIEWQVLADIYDDVIYLLGYPLKDKRHKSEYHHDNKLVEGIVRRKINDFEFEIDAYWSYWHKNYPELSGMEGDKKREIIEIVDKEIEQALSCQQNISDIILSPAFYSDNEDVYLKLKFIQKHIIKNSKLFPKRIRDLAYDTIDNDPKDVMMKYKAQLEYDDMYFFHNKPAFVDPYRIFLLTLRRRHDWLILNFIKKFKEIIRQIWYSKGKAIFSKDKWLFTGPILE